MNAAIQAQGEGRDQTEAVTYDLEPIDLEALRDEFARGPRRATALHDVRQIVEQKLANMLAQNPLRMDYYRRYQEIVADSTERRTAQRLKTLLRERWSWCRALMRNNGGLHRKG